MKLNGFQVDPQLEVLINRSDWCGKRTSPIWLSAFAPHPEAERMAFVDLCSGEHMEFENESIWQLRELGQSAESEPDPLAGHPDSEYPPGDVDVNAAYLIGFTDYCDSGIFVDLRPTLPRIIYDILNPMRATYATAFETIEEFLTFYHSTLEKMP